MMYRVLPVLFVLLVIACSSEDDSTPESQVGEAGGTGTPGTGGTGASGTAGAAGVSSAGAAGAAGVSSAGAAGAAGASGASGAAGVAGTAGASGVGGAAGVDCFASRESLAKCGCEHAVECGQTQDAQSCIDEYTVYLDKYQGECFEAEKARVSCVMALTCAELEEHLSYGATCSDDDPTGENQPYCRSEDRAFSAACPFYTPCQEHDDFVCADGSSKPWNWLCNGDTDCADGSDESDCACTNGPYCYNG